MGNDEHSDRGGPVGDLIQLVTFQLEEQVYGINVLQVQEVLRVGEIAPVPGAPEYFLGIINLRGTVVTVLDGRSRFGLPEVERDPANRIVIIESDGEVTGILVDRVAEVKEIALPEITPAPNIGSGGCSRYIEGVVSREGELLVVVDLNRLLSDEEWREVRAP
ncbi:MAG: chemotaxis protein CheW [gamma proteobacterium symbiont of Phacoides pectinatus]